MLIFHYIRGHQDDHTLYNKLSFGAELNVQANQLAEDFYGQPNFQPRILMLPACPTALEINSIIITNNFRTQLQQAWIKSFREEQFECT